MLGRLLVPAFLLGLTSSHLGKSDVLVDGLVWNLEFSVGMI